MSSLRSTVCLAACVLWMTPGLSFAATATTSFQVTATVPDSCVVAANDLSFGNYDPVSGSDLDGSSTIDVTCTLGTSYDIGLDKGVGSGATVASRKMASGSDLLDYGLYQDAGRNTVWGDTVASDTVSGTGTGAVQSYTVYGRVPASQVVPVGNYSDTITVTVTF
jgi:spore coat protein U-like protein